jgi:hypothetical protein
MGSTRVEMTENGSKENGPAPFPSQVVGRTNAGILVSIAVVKSLAENSLITPDYVIDLLRHTIRIVSLDENVSKKAFGEFEQEINDAIELIRSWMPE